MAKMQTDLAALKESGERLILIFTITAPKLLAKTFIVLLQSHSMADCHQI